MRDVRSLGLGMADDPWPPGVPGPDHPRHEAHALISGLETLGKNARIKRQRALVRVESLRFVHG